MAKMFYSLAEAAKRLGKSEADVRQMASRGEITEFRDGDRLLFKVDQIDLLAGDDDHDTADMSSMIPLADTGGASAINLAESAAGASGVGLSSGTFDIDESGPGASGSGLGGSGSGSGLGAEGPKERSGIPVFDADELEAADPSAQTQLSEGGFEGGLNLEALGSGSGLMDLTRESDDTSLGAEGLLDELYPAGEQGQATESEGGLFEGSPTAGELGVGAGEAAGAVAVAAAEVYDGAGSGLTGGLSLGMVAACGLAAALVIMSVIGFVPGFFASIGGENAPLIWTGGLAGVALVLGIVGWLVGKKSG